jgi:hypothetical protein
MGAECQKCDEAELMSELETKKVSIADVPPTPKRRRRRADQED